jgi:ComF family protein
MWINAYQKTAGFLAELFFPSFCLGCRREGALLCQDCQATLDISEHRYCLCSKHPLRIPPGQHEGVCRRCESGPLAGIWSALPYQERFLTKKLVYQFKYPPRLKQLAKPLAGILREHFARTGFTGGSAGAVLVPVPMDLKKMKDRGYNQAQALAAELSIAMQVPMETALKKIKRTSSQTTLSAKHREINVAGAFAADPETPVRGKTVFLVDDVYTTGSTMQECARVLKSAGAKTVWGISVAREG